MDSPFKYWRSFFWETVVETSSSPFNACLEVWYVNGRHTINGRNVNHSFGSLDKVFREAFEKLGLKDRAWRDVLLLGLGGGNVPAILGEQGHDYRIRAVEIDAEMVRLARKWCGLDAHKGLEIVIGDAVEFVGRDEDLYDLVIVDLFVEEQVPAGAEAEAFLLACAARLRAGGALMFNRLMHTPELEELSVGFSRKMEEVLPGSRYIRAHTNRMMVYEK